MREVERAVNKGIAIIPLRIADIPLSKSLEYFLSMAHWLDAIIPPLQDHLETLAQRVGQLLANDQDVVSVQPAPGLTPTASPRRWWLVGLLSLTAVLVLALIGW
jgi:hypothetical protein